MKNECNEISMKMSSLSNNNLEEIRHSNRTNSAMTLSKLTERMSNTNRSDFIKSARSFNLK